MTDRNDHVPARAPDATRRRLFIAIVTKGGGAFLAFVGFALLSATSSLTTFGLVGSIFALASIGGVVGSAGLHVAVLRLWPERHRTVGPAAADEASGAVAQVSMATALAGSIGTAAVVLLAFDQDATAALAAGLLAFLLTVAEYVNGLLRAQGRDLLALVPKDLVWRIAVLGVFAMAALTDTDLSVAEALWVFVACLGAALTFQLPALSDQLRQKRPSIREARVLLALSGPMWIGAVLAVSAQLLDVAVVGAFFDGETAALYVAATRISALVALPLVALNQQSGPMIADAFYSSGPSAVQVLFRRFMRFSLGSNVALIAVLLLAGAPLLDVFDVDTSRALSILAVLVVGNTVDALSGPSNMALQMLGQQRISMVIGIVAQAASVLVIVAGIVLDTVVLIALSNVLLQVCRNVPAVVVLRRVHSLDPSVAGMRA